MKCPNCLRENAEGAKFCSACGIKLGMICPACGKTSLPGSNFCSECGQSLSIPSSIPTGRGPATEAERKHVTVLFSDLSGYTSMSEKLDPEEVKDITSRIFGEVAQVVSRYDGFVEKYIGDAVVALFGVPKAHEDDHLRAIRAAREIHGIVDSMERRYEERIGAPLTFHTGITTGLVVTGEVNIEKGTHGITGDTINLASRLSGLAAPGEIVVGESTYLQSKGTFSFERLPPASVKGRAEPVISYRLRGEKEQPLRGLAAQALASPFVGRHAEVAAIRGCINRLLDGQGGIVSLVGEAGLGKSRLIAEIHRAFAHEHLLWLEGKTLSYGQKMSYWPFREILWQYAGITEDDGSAQAWEKFERRITDLFPTESGEILPYLASLIGLEVKGPLGENLRHMDGESMGKQIYLSSRRLFERLSGTPLVLVFEDLHWADESTVALIAHLFPLTTRVPLLICGVSRPETDVPAVRLRETALKDHERRYTEIRLSPLSFIECTDLMNSLLTIENRPSRMRQLILQKADGNPFFVEEIMRTLVDREMVRCENGRWRATSALESLTIPDTIQGVIIARIDRLDEEVKQILKAASVIGMTFLYRLLKEVSDAVKQLDRHLDTLTATELIREKQRLPELEYIFKHALVQESTYESILLKKRVELHGKVASAIEILFSDRLDEFSSVLAYHYAKAEHWEKAQEYLFKAGDQAGRIAADAEALTHYEQALQTYAKVFGERWDPVQRGILERKMGEAFYRRGEYDRAIEYLQRALVYFGRPRLPTSPGKIRLEILKEITTQVVHRLLSTWLVKKEDGSGDLVVQEVLRIYEIVQGNAVTGAPELFLLMTLDRLNFSERRGHFAGIVSGSTDLAATAWLLSFFHLARFFLRRAAVLAKQTQDPSALVVVYINLAFSEACAGQLDKAIEDGIKGIEIARTTGYWHLTFWGHLNYFVFWAYYLRGDMRSCLAIAQELVGAGQDANERAVLVIGLWGLGVVQQWKGDFQEAAATLTRVNELAEAILMHNGRVVAGAFSGRTYSRMGDFERSMAMLAQTDEYRRKHGVRGLDYFLPMEFFRTRLAIAEHAEGIRRDECLREAKHACRRVLKWTKGYRVILPEAMRLRGLYDWLTGRRSEALKYWQCSISLAQEMGTRYDLAMTHVEMGRRLNDREHLQKAERIFADIGAEFDLAETRKLLEPLAEK